MKDENLSRLLSYILRHHPHDYGLVLEEQGWVDAWELIAAIRTKHEEYAPLRYEDLSRVVGTAVKKRHELLDGRIRAVYGHSTDVVTAYEACQPPKVLYHGTPGRNVFIIAEEGLKSMQRHYVHMTEDVREAKNVGSRKGGETIVLSVMAEQASREGLQFLKAGPVWLCTHVPARYIVFPE